MIRARMRWVGFWALLVALAGGADLVAPGGAAAVEAHGGAALAITGHVVKGDARKPASGIPVALHIVKGDQELPGESTLTGSDGTFRFTDLSNDPTLSYFLSTEYAGAFYTEGPVDTQGKTEASHDLIIYDVGQDIGAVRVTNHHIVVDRKPDHLHITEILILGNSGRTAYLGTGLNHAENVGFRLGLPAAVKSFEPGMGLDAQSVNVQGRDLASQRPIPPGTHSFSFTYDVPLSGRMDLSHRLYFPTDHFMVLMGDPKLHLDSKSLRSMGQTDQGGGGKYALYEGENFPIGAEVTMRVGGAGFWSNPGVYPWLAAPFVIVGILFFAARRGRMAKEAGGGEHGAAVAEHGGPHGAVVAEHDGARAAGAGHAGSAPHAESATHGATAPPAPAAFPAIGLPSAGRQGSAGAGGPDDSDDFASVYLYLIDALDRGVERGEFSKESYTLVRGNLKRRLETILSDRPRTGTR